MFNTYISNKRNKEEKCSSSGKKIYSSPELVEYGDIYKLTKSGKNDEPDGGLGSVQTG